jgi:N-acetylmuramoyl-L-alanine amidase
MGKIILDCGHGGTLAASRSTPLGAVGPRGLREKDVTLRLGARVAHHLGDDALLTRDGDHNLSLAARAALARDHRAAVFVSLHANAGAPGERGPETWIHPRAGRPSHALATAIQRGLARLGGPDRGVHTGDLAVLAPERLPASTAACLVEVDFLSDPDGERRLGDPAELDRIARAIASAIRTYGSTNTTGNDPRLVELERRLFRVLREHQPTFRAGVAAVVRFWQAFARQYVFIHGLDLDANKLTECIRRAELFTPELVQASGRGVDAAEALGLWSDLVHGDRLEHASTDLLMGFLRILFDAYLDPRDAYERSLVVLGADIPSPREARGYAARPSSALAELRTYFDDRGRVADRVGKFVPIAGNIPITPADAARVRPFLDPTDPAYTVLLQRGTDLWALDMANPFFARLERLGLPHAAGVSGSAADFVALGKIAGLSPDAMARYAMAILYFIGLPGHHSFAEIAFVLAANGVAAFNPRPHHGDYPGPLTRELRDTIGYQRLAEAFPDQLLAS